MTDALDEFVRAHPSGTLSRWLLGSTEPSAIRDRLRRWSADHLDAAIDDVFLCTMSVGAVFGVALDDGRRVAIKVLRPDMEARRAAAARTVHGALHRAGFPSPEPLLPPISFGPNAIALVDRFVEGGSVGDGHEPAIRRAGAAGLVRLVALAATVAGTEALTVPAPLPPGDLWPTPHNPLFDFRATAGGAAWIDALAREARAVVGDAGAPVVIHTDWTVRNLRFDGERLHVVFDWDSIGRDVEARVVGTAAATFPTGGLEAGTGPSTPAEAGAFVADYDTARGSPVAPRARESIGAAALYAMAYGARCEHAVDRSGSRAGGSYRQMLREHGRAYLGVGA